MGLAQALTEIPEAQPSARCKVARLREQLTGDDLAALNSALEAVYNAPRSARMGGKNGATATWLAKVLSDNGYPITDGTIQRHIRGECSCGII